MDHNKTLDAESAPAVAETDSASNVPREFGIMCKVSVMASADAPAFIGAKCPTCRLSSARPMFIGRAVAGNRDGTLPRQDFTSIPPKPSPCPEKKGQDMARQTNRFEEVRRFVAGVDLAGHADHYVCGPRKDDGPHDIEHFGTTTGDIARMVAWLKERNVTSAAMESARSPT